MTEKIDKSLVLQTRRKPLKGGLTINQKVAINILSRFDGVRVKILAKAFNISPNTIYYQCLTGGAESYLQGATNTAAEVTRLVDDMGEATARKKFVTDEMVASVNKEMATWLKRQG